MTAKSVGFINKLDEKKRSLWGFSFTQKCFVQNWSSPGFQYPEISWSSVYGDIL